MIVRRCDIPDCVWAKFISTHNDFHAGSGNSFLDRAHDSLNMEHRWKEHCRKTGMCSLAVVFIVFSFLFSFFADLWRLGDCVGMNPTPCMTYTRHELVVKLSSIQPQPHVSLDDV